MAAPNIVGINTVIGITTMRSLGDTSATTLLSNPAGSNYVYKINTIIVANDDGSSADIIAPHDHDDGAEPHTKSPTQMQLQQITLSLLTKHRQFILKKIVLSKPQHPANDLDVICPYESIID